MEEANNAAAAAAAAVRCFHAQVSREADMYNNRDADKLKAHSTRATRDESTTSVTIVSKHASDIVSSLCKRFPSQRYLSFNIFAPIAPFTSQFLITGVVCGVEKVAAL